MYDPIELALGMNNERDEDMDPARYHPRLLMIQRQKLVNAVSLIGLTLETAEYLFEHDPVALKAIDEALEAIGTPIKTLRNRSVEWHREDAELFKLEQLDGSTRTSQRVGHTFLPVTEDGIDAKSVEDYIEEHLQSPDGTWELVFFPNGEPRPSGVAEDYMAMYDADDFDRKERSISPMHLQELDYLDVIADDTTEAEARMKRISEVMDANARLAAVDNALDEIDQYVQPAKRPSRRSTRPRSG